MSSKNNMVTLGFRDLELASILSQLVLLLGGVESNLVCGKQWQMGCQKQFHMGINVRVNIFFQTTFLKCRKK